VVLMRGLEDYWARGIRHGNITQEQQQAVLDEFERTEGRMDDPRPPPSWTLDVTYVRRDADEGIAGYVRRDGEVVPITYAELEEMNRSATEAPAIEEADSTSPPLPIDVDPAPMPRPVPSPPADQAVEMREIRRPSVEMWDEQPREPDRPIQRPPSPDLLQELVQMDDHEPPIPDLVPMPEDDELNHHHFDRECRFCFSRMTNSMLMPCHHAVYCLTCATALKKYGYRCILCRKPIEEVIRMLGH
jgi:hypothetical protein